MTEKDLKRLSRSELLELLLIQTKETERLSQELEKTEKMLADRNLKMEKSGDLAQAVLAVNGIMEAAQATAKQYLDNIARMEQETKARCEKNADGGRAGSCSDPSESQKYGRETHI